jgi:hypothetical protein
MSWILTREDDTEFSMIFDTEEECSSYMHSVNSDNQIIWFCEIT